MKIAHFDAFSGISGDMTVGALLDAGADFAALTAALGSLGTGAGFRVEKVKRHGIAASKFFVDFEEQKKHRHLPAILRIIETSAIPDGAKHNATKVFERLAAAEALAHGVAIEKVHFHEVGAVDSICDIAGACTALALLGVEHVTCSPLNTGSGTVNTEHGELPIPAPATARLLEQVPVYARGPRMELTTPTGAALAVTLAASFGPPPPMTLGRSGFGAGDKDFKEHANVLRVLLGEGSGASESTTVSVLEANLDDASPQVLAYTLDRLIAQGALDATLQPLIMKKGRPGVLLRVVARPEDQEALAALVFAETPTLGLRIHAAERRVLAREFVDVSTPHGTVRMKVSEHGFAPEYEDCRKLAEATGVPLKRILADATAAYLNQK